MLTFSALSNSAFPSSTPSSNQRTALSTSSGSSHISHRTQTSARKPSTPSAPIRFGASDAESSIPNTPTARFTRSILQNDWTRDTHHFMLAAKTANRQGMINLLNQQSSDCRKASLVSTKDECSDITPLHLLAESRRFRYDHSRAHLESITRLLLNRGASIDAQDCFGRTPLMLAALEGDTSMVSILLSHGAKTKQIDSEGYTALDFAKLCSPSETGLIQFLIFHHTQ